MKRKAWLVLSDGTVMEGTGFGADTECTGELVFTTNMCGYIETLSDPSYAGQIVMQTFPLIGNYGIIPEDFEGEPALKGYAVREYCDTPSNFRSQKTLDAFLKEKGIPGIAGIDTRHVTQILREYGVMNAAIVSEKPADLSFLRDYAVKDAVAEVSVKKTQIFPAENKKHAVVLIDCGAKRNIVRELNLRGCDVTAIPYDTAAEEILSYDPDGIMLSNGPGDPAENIYTIEQIRKLLGRVPMFGICLGHQLTALAAGASTYKMKYGHRGANQPVKDLITDRTWITTQNHGYAVDGGTLPPFAKVRMINANDGSCEGIDYPEHMCFTVQFHPEACAGPKDTAYLFDRFLKMMEENN